jgi:hypothetical protein
LASTLVPETPLRFAESYRNKQGLNAWKKDVAPQLSPATVRQSFGAFQKLPTSAIKSDPPTRKLEKFELTA